MDHAFDVRTSAVLRLGQALMMLPATLLLLAMGRPFAVLHQQTTEQVRPLGPGALRDETSRLADRGYLDTAVDAAGPTGAVARLLLVLGIAVCVGQLAVVASALAPARDAGALPRWFTIVLVVGTVALLVTVAALRVLVGQVAAQDGVDDFDLLTREGTTLGLIVVSALLTLAVVTLQARLKES